MNALLARRRRHQPRPGRHAEDTFAQLLLKPHPRVQVRIDAHRLRLSELKDLWYAGGSATNDDVFGFSGTPWAGAW